MNIENAYKIEIDGQSDVTRAIIKKIIRRAEELPFSEHPYNHVVEAREEAGFSSWETAGEDHQIAAKKSLGHWAFRVIADGTASMMVEVIRLMLIAKQTDDDAIEEPSDLAAAANDVFTSLPYLQLVINGFMQNLDFDRVGEALFQHGRKMAEARAEEEAAAEAAKAKVMRAHPTTN